MGSLHPFKKGLPLTPGPSTLLVGPRCLDSTWARGLRNKERVEDPMAEGRTVPDKTRVHSQSRFRRGRWMFLFRGNLGIAPSHPENKGVSGVVGSRVGRRETRSRSFPYVTYRKGERR